MLCFGVTDTEIVILMIFFDTEVVYVLIFFLYEQGDFQLQLLFFSLSWTLQVYKTASWYSK